MQTLPFEFCGASLLAGNVSLAGPILKRGEGLLIANQVFAFDHVRDEIEVTVTGRLPDGPETLTASIPITTGFSKTHFRFPVMGTWYVEGPSFHTAHRPHVPEEFALDIMGIGNAGKVYRSNGLKFTDYYGYGARILAAADGRVVAVENSRREDPASLQRPGESAEAYAARHTGSEIAQMQGTGIDWAVGNYVLIDHGDSEYSLYSHMQPGTVRVKAGERVRAGDELGLLGSSGNSSGPHLHFQVCDRPAVLLCDGIPVTFSNISIYDADAPRPVQSGDLVTAR